jgi:hypothetical protein
MEFPPPHRVIYECLNDREMQAYWTAYKLAHAEHADFEEVDAAVMNSMDDFATWFAQWMTFAPSRPSVRIRLLLIWHAHFLSLACQQMLRRSLEQRSFRCRVWFHIEEPVLQSAILSRCIVSRLPQYSHVPRIVGPPPSLDLWNDPRKVETDFDTTSS